jgi:hypothetical protein
MNILLQGLKALADLLMLYIQSLMLYPIQFWIGVGLTALGLYLIRRLFDYWFWVISGRINQHPGQERLYQVLWRFRDARDSLTPNETKWLLTDAIRLIDEKKITLRYIKGIRDRLPDIGNATVGNERVTINNILMIVKEEIHELELRLPPVLILWEKFVLRMRVGFMFLLGVVAFFAATSLALQLIFFGIRLFYS